MICLRNLVLIILSMIYPINLYALSSEDNQNNGCCKQKDPTIVQAKLIRCDKKIIINKDGNPSELNIGLDISTTFALSKVFFMYRVYQNDPYIKLPVPRARDLKYWISIKYVPRFEYYLWLISERGEDATIYSRENPCTVKASEIKRKQRKSDNKKYLFFGSVITGIATAVAILAGGGDRAGGPNPTNPKAIVIQSPIEGSLVNWETSVYGHVTEFAADDYVTISIQPHTDDWVPQSNTGSIDSSGNWVVHNCYFGLQGEIDKGSIFRFKAELRDRDGKIKITDLVNTVIRN